VMLKLSAATSIAALLATGAAPARGEEWRIHDMKRPRPDVVAPAAEAGGAPGDAVVLFDGSDLSAWVGRDGSAAPWKVGSGYVEVVPRSGPIRTRQSFGDCQLHIEWSTPPPEGEGQGRGNSGIFLMNNYEIQVLDSYDNKTYFHGQAGSIYKQHKPLANPMRKPGEWNVYDIVFNAPVFDDDGKLLKRATFTAFLNGVLVQDHVEVMGVTAHDRPPYYEKHAAKKSCPSSVSSWKRTPVCFTRMTFCQSTSVRPEARTLSKIGLSGCHQRLE